MSKKVEYNLNLHEAIDIVLAGGAVRGEQFRKGYFLKLNSNEQLVLVYLSDFYKEDTWVSFGSLGRQKFRELSVMTEKELSK
jgi:hypothetical protein